MPVKPSNSSNTLGNSNTSTTKKPPASKTPSPIVPAITTATPKGVCSFPEPIKNLDELEPCKIIASDVIIDRHTRGKVPTMTFDIRGCLIVDNSIFDAVTLYQFNKQYQKKCIKRGPHNETESTFIGGRLSLTNYDVTRMHKHATLELNKKCDGSMTPALYKWCHGDEFWTTKCTKVVGTLTMEGADLRKSCRLIEIQGTFNLTGNKYNDLYFPNLFYIDSVDAPAIIVEDNMNLELLTFQSLQHIITTHPQAVIFNNNPNILSSKKNKANLEHLKKITGNRVFIDGIRYGEQESSAIAQSSGRTENETVKKIPLWWFNLFCVHLIMMLLMAAGIVYLTLVKKQKPAANEDEEKYSDSVKPGDSMKPGHSANPGDSIRPG